MKSFLLLLLTSIVFSPVSHAVTYDDLLDDIDNLDDVLSTYEEEEEEEDEDVLIEESEELFPDVVIDEGGEEPEEVSPYVIVYSEEQGEVELTDVPTDAWFAPFVKDLTEVGIFSGYKDLSGRLTGLFGPADNVTIEQLAKVAVIAAGIDLESCVGEVQNLRARGRWSERYILCAEHRRLAVFNEATVEIERPATRAEVVVTILQAFRVDVGDPGPSPFKDVDTSTEFSNWIIRASLDSIVSGYRDEDGTPLRLFGPNDPVTRAGITKIISLARQTY